MWWRKGKPKTENRKVLVIFNLMLHYNHTTSSLEVTKIHSAQSGLSSVCEALYHLDAVFDILRRNQRPLMSFFLFFCKGAGYACGWEKCGCSSPSGNIVVLVRSLLVTFHVVPVYERLNPLLQITRLWKNKSDSHVDELCCGTKAKWTNINIHHCRPWRGISVGCRALTPAGYDWGSSSSSWCAPPLHRSDTACLETHVLWCWPAPLPKGKIIQLF